jgi:hypothetical protein
VGRIGAWLAICLLALLADPGALRAAPGERLVVRGSEVPLREAPQADAPVVLLLGPEHRLVEFARREDWVKVGVFETVGAFGWLPADAVEAAPAPVPLPEPEPAPIVTAPSLPVYHLQLSGRPALLFRATCRIIGGGRDRTLKFDATLPKSYRWEAEAVSCRVLKMDALGHLRARLYKSDSLIASRQTTAPFNYVRVRSDGPWGGSRASRGSTGFVTRPLPPKPPGGGSVVIKPGG